MWGLVVLLQSNLILSRFQSFYTYHYFLIMKIQNYLLSAFAALTLVSGSVLVANPSFAQTASGTVPTDVQTGIDNAQATVTALSPLALACLVVALTPMGAMLTLRFLNMVLSRV